MRRERMRRKWGKGKKMENVGETKKRMDKDKKERADFGMKVEDTEDLFEL